MYLNIIAILVEMETGNILGGGSDQEDGDGE